MAKKKSTEEVAPIAEQANAPELEAQTENTCGTEAENPQPEEATQIETPTNEEQPKMDGDDVQPEAGVKAPTQVPVPDDVLAYLKRHPEEEVVYIDKLGGVFSAKTPKAFLKGAVLYQNPFFKQ